MFEPYLEKQKLFARCLKFMLGLQGFLKHIYIYKVCETFCPALCMLKRFDYFCTGESIPFERKISRAKFAMFSASVPIAYWLSLL